MAGIVAGSLAQGADPPNAGTYRSLLSSVHVEDLQRDYHQIESFGDRLTGSAGEQKTFDYAEAQLRGLGAAKITREPFDVAVPDPASTGQLAADGYTSKILPLWPNLVRTSTCHAKGRLLYVKRGDLESFSGLPVQGSIVLMEFNSGSNWRNAAKLGAAAVVFIAPKGMPRAEAEAKFSSVPLDIPRFFLPEPDSGPILTAAMHRHLGSLDCRQDWLPLKSCNLIADFAGTDPKLADEPMAVSAYADSISVVPGLNPGAEGCGGLAVALEVARIFAARPHPRPLRVVIEGAHSLALQGAREFASTRFTKHDQPLLTISLDISSGSGALGCFGRGWFYDFRDESEWAVQQISRIFRSHVEDLAKVEGIDPPRRLMTDAVNNGDDRTWKNNISGKFALDCEPLVLAGLNAVTFRTIEDSRQLVDTPLDTLNRIDFGNVLRQAQTTTVLVYHALTDRLDKSGTDNNRIPLDNVDPQRMRLIGGFASVSGQVVSYDPQKSFVPDIPEPGALAVVASTQKTLMGVRGDMVEFTTGKGDYYFDGLAPLNAYGDAGTTFRETEIDAFKLDAQTGKIVFAPTWQLPGFEAYNTIFSLTTSSRESPIVVFPCVSVDMYDMVDPQSLTALTRTKLLDPATGTAPRNFGIFVASFNLQFMADVEDAQVVFLPPGQAFQATSGDRVDLQRAILTGSTLTNEAGIGYGAPGSKPTGTRFDSAIDGLFHFLPLETATDINNLNQARVAQFDKYRILSPGTKALANEAQDEIAAAQDSMRHEDWAGVERHGRAAWGLALRAHPIIMGTANDVVNGVVFYLFLLIPFSFFLERLFVGSQLLSRQITWSVIFFISSFVLLRLIHPAFEIVTNPSMIFIAFVMGALSIIVISFIVGKFESSMRAIRAQQSGIHDVDIRRSSVAMAAFNLGVSNMRRRKARTVLTTLTLVVMTFIVLSFTSIVSELSLTQTPSQNVATYSGILVRTPGLDTLELSTYRQLTNEFSGKALISRRAYYYGADVRDKGILTLRRGENSADVRAMLGLDPTESEILKPQTALLEGRWIRPGERNVMLLPQSLARTLKIEPSEVGRATVTYAGQQFTVIGIVNTAVMRSIKDLDGDGLMPADFTLSRDYQDQKATSNQAFRNFIRLDPSAVFIVPAQTALDLGADIRTIAVMFRDPAVTQKELESLMPRLRLNLYAGVPESTGSSSLVVREFSVQESNQSAGIVLVLVQLILAGVFVLNTMVASVYERTREIAIFSSIGLAPNHISMLFFAESLVYGILGAVIGYFVAQGTARIIVMTHSLQGLTLNFSSGSAVLSAGVVMAVVLLSTIYPARKAAQIAAPAMNEEVFQTEPAGDVWDLPLPFSVSSAEAAPISVFLLDWLKAYEGFTIGDFVSADAALEREETRLGPAFHLTAVTWLAPYDLGVSQYMRLSLSPSEAPGIYLLDLRLTRLSGDADNWPVVNQRFLADIRKEFLTWRTLPAAGRQKYLDAA